MVDEIRLRAHACPLDEADSEAYMCLRLFGMKRPGRRWLRFRIS
jgi:hypothetical protein